MTSDDAVLDGGLFLKASCTVLPGFATSWQSSNSTVTSSPIVDFAQWCGSNKMRFSTVSLVEIRGRSGEELHFHLSHLVGLVISGHGEFHYLDDSGSRCMTPVRRGDAVVIPIDAMHIFEAGDGEEMAYIALDLGPDMPDYQKHHHI